MSECNLFGFDLRRILPMIPIEQLAVVKLKLIEEIGVFCKDDLRFLQEQDLKDSLKPVQIRRLLEAFKQGEFCANENINVSNPSLFDLSTVANPLTSPNSSHIGSNIVTSSVMVSNIDSTWSNTFKIPWNKFPEEVMIPLRNKVRLHTTVQRTFIRYLADEIRKICKRPLKKDLIVISRQVVSKYPSCFGDAIGNNKLVHGYETILKQLQHRCENLNRKRTHTSHQIPKRNSNAADIATPNIGYGSQNWNPERLPPGENEVTQCVKREELKKMLCGELISVDVDLMKTLLSDTYVSQRKDINASQGVGDVYKNWPLLFTKEGLILHCQLLVGLNFFEKLEQSFLEKYERVVSCLKADGKGNSSLVKTSSDKKMFEKRDDEFIILIQLLASHFNEKADYLFVAEDGFVTKSDVQNKELPKTPCVIISGAQTNKPLHMLAVDGVVVNEKITLFFEAFAMLLCSYFCLNIAYAEEAVATLEFLQRCFLDINPDHGRKRSGKKGKYKGHPKVLRLLSLIERPHFAESET